MRCGVLAMLRVLVLAWLPALSAGPAVPQPAILSAAAMAVPAGSPAELRCSVLNQGDRQVSWVRSRDLQILTHAGIVFTGDSRVTVPHDVPHDDSDNVIDSAAYPLPPEDISQHSLRIASVRPTDAGRYECQLNTEPKMSRSVNLTVLDPESVQHHHPPESVQLGWVKACPPMVVAPRGGEAVLSCEAGGERGGEEAGPVRWYRNGDLILPQGSTDEVSLEWQEWHGGGVSRLKLRGVQGAQGGRYRCQRGAYGDTVNLVVEDIANDEALSMQASRSATAASIGLTLTPIAVAVMGLMGNWVAAGIGAGG